MNKFLWLLLLVIISFPANADNSLKKNENERKIYYDGRVNLFLFIPLDVTMAVGTEMSSGLFEIEAYTGIRAIRLFSGDDKSIHLPYGARVRMALNSSKTIYMEYQYEKIEDFGKKNGKNEKNHVFSLINFFNNKKNYWGCGAGKSIHHAWSNESHEPEDGNYFECSLGVRF